MKKSSGFTLIELLVVIAVIAVLATIGVSTYTTVQQQARDGRSQADIRAIANSIESARTIDANAGTVTYTYTTTNFSSDFRTAPSGKNAYCVKSAAAAVANPTTAWTTACDTTNGWYAPTVATGLPSASAYWKVCTYLERTTTPFCVASISQ